LARIKKYGRPNLKTIVWDVDDVLNELMREWFTLCWVPDHGDQRITYEDIRENPPHQILGMSRQEYLASLDRFRLSEYAANMYPKPSLIKWFETYGNEFHHVALTATPLKSASKSAAWVMRHFGTWIRSYNFIPSMREHECLRVFHASKEDFLRWWGKADILVDDHPVNLTGAASLGIRAVCMPQPWNSCELNLAQTLELLGDLR
jgi:hypothetical protein